MGTESTDKPSTQNTLLQHIQQTNPSQQRYDKNREDTAYTKEYMTNT